MARYGLSLSPQNVQCPREALRCLANAMLLQPNTRQTFIEYELPPKLARIFSEISDFDDEFLCSRILFLLTYETSYDFTPLIQDQTLADSIAKVMRRICSPLSCYSSRGIQSLRQHAAMKGSSKRTMAGSMEGMALSQSLKLLFNVLHFYPSQAKRFSGSTSSIISILLQEKKLQDPPIEPPTSELVNALLNLDLKISDRNALFPLSNPTSVVDHLIRILEAGLKHYPEKELDVAASPCISLLRRLHDLAPEDVKDFMRHRLLPTDQERKKPLGKSETLPARLLRLSTSGHTPTLRDSIPVMLFELSGKDAEKFVRNVGYGYASGFLTNNNIPAPHPPNPRDGQSSSGHQRGRSGNASENEVNFVTGQYLADEPHVEGPPMSEDEKMQEAEKLFVLFERSVLGACPLSFATN